MTEEEKIALRNLYENNEFDQLSNTQYFQNMVQDFEIWRSGQENQRAIDYNNVIHRRNPNFSLDTKNPHYFTGNFFSDVVTVFLNYARKVKEYNQDCRYNSFLDYHNFNKKFGTNRYPGNVHVAAKFDLSQIRFLYFLRDELNFDEYSIHQPNRNINLRNVIDNKLQLELLPFGSPDFNVLYFRGIDLNPLIQNLMEVIGIRQRSIVIFCGRIFQELLNNYGTDQRIEQFNNGQGRLTYRFIFKRIQFNNKLIPIVIAPTFFSQAADVLFYGNELGVRWEQYLNQFGGN